MEENKTLNNKKYTLIIVFALIISLLGLTYPIFSMIYLKEVSIEGIVKILCYLFVLYYLFIGYKKPHGNVMKGLFVTFGFTVVIQAISTAMISDNAAYLIGVSGVIVAFIGGRLNKVKNNQVLATIVVSLLLLGYAISLSQATETDFVLKLTSLDLVVEWLAILSAYFVRYKMHKEAGNQTKEVGQSNEGK